MNKEEKYRTEIFNVLLEAIDEMDSKESELLKQFFIEEPIENDELIERIKKTL